MLKMFVTSIKNLFRKPATQLYPYEPYEPFEGYRGRISWEREKCTFCMRCERVCTAGAIKILVHSDDSKEWVWNPLQCIYCGECTRNCPVGALKQQEHYSIPVTKKDKLDWSELEKRAEKLKKLWRRRLRERRSKKSGGMKQG